MANENMTVPFVTKDTPKEKVERMRSQMEQPFTTVDTPPRKKLYLLLKFYDTGSNMEMDRDFEYFRGTTQELYDHIKEELLYEDMRKLDVMKSRVLVDAPNIRISHKCSIFMFMKDTKDLKKITDDTGFDIMEYHSDNEEGDDIVG